MKMEGEAASAIAQHKLAKRKRDSAQHKLAKRKRDSAQHKLRERDTVPFFLIFLIFQIA
jgi:hypothetical protein